MNVVQSNINIVTFDVHIIVYCNYLIAKFKTTVLNNKNFFIGRYTWPLVAPIIIRDIIPFRALKMAIAFQASPKGCIHYTDRGSQYCSHDYQKILRQHDFKASMSGKGNCYDNAAVETVFKTIKAELIWRHSWETRRQAEMAIFEYINGFYNPRRRHSTLGWKSPVAFERKVA